MEMFFRTMPVHPRVHATQAIYTCPTKTSCEWEKSKVKNIIIIIEEVVYSLSIRLTTTTKVKREEGNTQL